MLSAAHPVADPSAGLLDPSIYVLETAAIDRFSSWVLDLIDWLPCVVLSDFTQMIAGLWATLLRNFVRYKGFEPLAVSDVYPKWGTATGNVYFVQESFDTRNDCLAQDWVRDMLDLHPGIKQQF